MAWRGIAWRCTEGCEARCAVPLSGGQDRRASRPPRLHCAVRPRAARGLAPPCAALRWTFECGCQTRCTTCSRRLAAHCPFMRYALSLPRERPGTTRRSAVTDDLVEDLKKALDQVTPSSTRTHRPPRRGCGDASTRGKAPSARCKVTI